MEHAAGPRPNTDEQLARNDPHCRAPCFRPCRRKCKDKATRLREADGDLERQPLTFDRVVVARPLRNLQGTDHTRARSPQLVPGMARREALHRSNEMPPSSTELAVFVSFAA